MKLLMILMTVLFFAGQATAYDNDPCNYDDVGEAFELCMAFYAEGCDDPLPERMEACDMIGDNIEIIIEYQQNNE